MRRGPHLEAQLSEWYTVDAVEPRSAAEYQPVRFGGSRPLFTAVTFFREATASAGPGALTQARGRPAPLNN